MSSIASILWLGRATVTESEWTREAVVAIEATACVPPTEAEAEAENSSFTARSVSERR
jgi:hypothetical protein